MKFVDVQCELIVVKKSGEEKMKHLLDNIVCFDITFLKLRWREFFGRQIGMETETHIQ